MLDLETFGNTTESVIVAIGAVKFEPHANTRRYPAKLDDDGFYVNVCPRDCQNYGLEISADTVLWWLDQSAEAREAITKPEKIPLKDALSQFSDWLPDDAVVWGNGSDFDNALLARAYEKTGLKVPWSFRNNRCYRTIKNLLPNIKIQREGNHHNALDDAKSQALHLTTILRSTRLA